MHFTMSEWLMRIRRFIKRGAVIDYNSLEWRKQSLPPKDDSSEKTSEHNDTAFDENSHGETIHNDGCLVENVSGNRAKTSQRQKSNLSLHCVSSNQLTENTNSCDNSTGCGVIFNVKGGFYFSIIRLIRAGDVETNPGPYDRCGLWMVPASCYDQLSQQFPADKYTQLSTLLGIANQANTILVQCENDYQKATRHVLWDWHNRMQNSGTVADLKTAITRAGAGELNSIIDESFEKEQRGRGLVGLVGLAEQQQRRLVEQLEQLGQRQRQRQQLAQTFKAALASGKALCKRSRLMVVGPAGVGKTSLIRRLTGKSFNSEEQSTVGVEISSVDKEEIHGWKPESKERRDDMAEALAHYTETNSQGTNLETMGAVGEANPQQKSILEIKMTKLLPSGIHQRVRRQRRSFQSGSTTYNVWDFGGQGIYYITHPLFFSWRSIYIVVFDLSTKLEEPPSRVEHIHDGNMTLVPLFLRTTQRVLHFWLMSIHVHAAPPKGMTTDSKYDPRILLACTFKNQVTKEEAKVQTDKLQDMIKGQPYAHQVIGRIVEVDNASSPEDEILELRDFIDKETMKMPHMKEELPIRWHTFADELDKLNEAGNSCPCLTMEQVKRMMIPLAFDEEEEVKKVLQFYHDTGRLVYHQGCDIIILDPQWLNDVVKEIICVGDDKKERGPLRNHWRQYHMKGVLSRELIAHVWKDLVTNPNEVLKMLVKLDLICAIPGTEEYFVPCRSSEQRESKERLADNDKFSFVIDFDDFLPVGYLHRFFVRMARWALDQGGSMPTFHFLEMIFYLDERHRVVMENDPNGDKPNQIQVTIHEVLRTDEDKDMCQTLRIKREFIDWLYDTLMDLKEAWARGISFSICVPCPHCEKHGDEALIPLKNFLQVGKAAICCEDCPAPIPTKRIQRIFSSDQDNAGQPEVSGAPLVANRHEISEVMLRDLANQLGEEWRSVGTYLGLQSPEIQALREEFSSLKECKFQMLLEWRNRNGVDATKVELKRVLTKAERADLEDIVDSSN